MIRQSVVVLVLVSSLIVAAVALVPNSPVPHVTPKGELGIAYHSPRYLTGRAHADCLAEPAECGLVVW